MTNSLLTSEERMKERVVNEKKIAQTVSAIKLEVEKPAALVEPQMTGMALNSARKLTMQQ